MYHYVNIHNKIYIINFLINVQIFNLKKGKDEALKNE